MKVQFARIQTLTGLACWRTSVGWSLLTVFSCLLFFTASLRAQTTSTIEGTVKDKSGAIIAGAHVRVVSTEMATDRSATSETDGTYHITALPPGIYEIRA